MGNFHELLRLSHFFLNFFSNRTVHQSRSSIKLYNKVYDHFTKRVTPVGCWLPTYYETLSDELRFNLVAKFKGGSMRVVVSYKLTL